MKKSYNQLFNKFTEYFEQELDDNLPVLILPDKSLMYKKYLIKLIKNNNWGVFDINSGDLIEQYYLKSCALIAANAYFQLNFEKFNLIKQLDNQYWSNYFNIKVLENSIKSIKDKDRYLILLDKLENSDAHINYCKNTISKTFRQTFA